MEKSIQKNKMVSSQKPIFKRKLYTIYERNNVNLDSNNDNNRVIPNLLGNYIKQMDDSYLQIDSYGLGYSLSIFHNFLEKTIPLRPAEDKDIINKLKLLVSALCKPSATKRIFINIFNDKIEKLLEASSSPKGNASTLTPAAASASAVSYGGKRKQTRRRRCMYRKKTYRKRRN
jgi:hypothetical protein